jgi:hypothetical protein
MRQLTTEFHERATLRMIEHEEKGFIFGIEDVARYPTDPDFDVAPPYDKKRKRYTDADLCVCATWVGGTSLFDVSENLAKDKQYGSRMILWRGHSNETYSNKGYEILEKRINRKLKQTKTSESTTRRMLFVELPTGLQGPSASAHHRLFADADRRFGGVAALVLTHRRPSRWKRFAYQGVLLQGTQESGIPDELYRRLNEVE